MMQANLSTEDKWLGVCEVAGRWLLAALLVCAMAAQANGGQNQLLTQETIEPLLRRYALQYGPWREETIELRVLPFQAVPVPAGKVNYRVLQPARVAGAGAQNFLIAAEIAGKEEARLWVKTEIRVFADVVVAVAPLGRHEIIAAKDIRVDRREIAGRTSRPITRLNDAVGKQLTRALDANEILSQNALDRPTAMKRGSTVTLVFESVGLRVESTGVADEGGKIGDLIQVKNSSSGKTLRGVVLDGRQVRVN
jgi:flagella basal body P-ring formation protein FlgA